MFKNRITTVFYILLFFLILFFSACSDISFNEPSIEDDNLMDGALISYDPMDSDFSYMNEETAEPNDSSFFYFSYDDSASTAAVELVKYNLNNNILPERSLSRPWEFLNYEEFSPESTEPLDTLFQISMGLIKRENSEDEMEYQLGVFIASPEIERTKNCVLTLVVDVSGSMDANALSTDGENESRLDIVKYGLTRMVGQSLKQGDILNLVIFSDDASTVFSQLEYSGNKSTIAESIASMETMGSTNLNAGLELGYTLANSTYDSEKTNRLILLTDAYLNTGEIDVNIISDSTRINDSEGIYMAGIGISSDVNESVMNQLTEAGKGAYFTALSKSDAGRIFTDDFTSLMEVAARDVRFKLNYPERLSHNVSASEESSLNEEEVQTTNFSYNTKQFFFEGFGAEEALLDSEEFTLTVTYKDPETLEVVESTVSKSVDQILGLNSNLIADAEAIVLLNDLIGQRKSSEEVQAILEDFYSDYSSDLFDEYVNLIEIYNSLNITDETTL